MSFALEAKGPYSLRAQIAFLRRFTPAQYDASAEDTLALAFVAEDGWEATAVEVSPTETGVHVDVHGQEPEGLRRQVMRMLSLDVDGSGLPDVGARDPVMGRLMRRYDQLRPVCFPSPFEAAAWGLLSHRARMSQAARLKKHIARTMGEPFWVGGEALHAFPTPRRLLEADAIEGVNETNLTRLHALARAALRGELDGDRLRAMSTAEALASLTTHAGIGPFTAELVLIRGAGAPDVMPATEKRLRRVVELAYGPGTTLEMVAPVWQPYRSWCAVLLRRFMEDEA